MTGIGSRRARRWCRGRAAPPGRRADGPAARRPRRPTPSSAPSAISAPTRARATSSNHRPPARRRSTTATAPTRPVAGSATASAQNTGPRRSRATRPPATAASSPKPVRTSCGGRRPWAVIESHTRGPPLATRCTASMPSWARARGRVDSITTSAVATSAPRASMPDRSPRSTQHRRLAGVDEVEERRRTAAGAVDAAGRLDLDDVHAGLGEQLPAQRPGPQRRQVDHPQPAQARHRCRPAPQLGGDHGDVVARDVRRARRRPGRARRRPRRASPTGAAGSRSPPRTTAPCRRRRRRSTPGADRGRRRRGSATASHPSAARSRRVDPPQLTAPRRVKPAIAARSPSRAGPSTWTDRPVPDVIVRSRSAAACITSTTPEGAPRGGPSRRPVNHIAPLAAQTAAASVRSGPATGVTRRLSVRRRGSR